MPASLPFVSLGVSLFSVSSLRMKVRLALLLSSIIFAVSQLHGSSDEAFPILARQAGETVWLERAMPPEAEGDALELGDVLRAQLETLYPAETELGLSSFLPAGSSLEAIEQREDGVVVLVNLTAELPADFDGEAFSRLLASWGGLLPETKGISLVARSPDGAEHLFEAAAPAPASKHEPVLSDAGAADEMVAMSVPHAPSQGTAQPSGALSDASIFLSPGHGWFFSTNLNRWATQRGNLHQYIEDFGTAEAVLQYLHQYLWNAGARIYTTRERDLNTHMVIVQHGGVGYQQTGSWTAQSVTGAYSGSHRYATTVTGSPTATARFTPEIPEAGHYAVYVWYRTASGGTTTTDARITVNHSGDSTLWVQDQNRDGHTWKYIGTYHFEAGFNPETGSVLIDNQSSVGGRRVVAGAVRFGGGMGDLPDDVSGTISGKPRWEESGRYYAGFMGKTDWASSGTVNAMPRWAAWEHESWEDGKSVYLSWHTNAGGGTGTETFAYSTTSGGAFAGVTGGDRLRNAIHDQVVRDIRAAWKSNWTDRGRKTANFGELNPSNNPKMPAALVEIGFHDHVEDTKYLLDPEFRRQVARAVYKGLVQYYLNEVPGFTNGTYLPEPPQRLRVRANANGTITLNWDAPQFSTGLTGLYGHAATGYRVYRSRNGHGFDNGIAVTGTTATLSGFEPGEVVYLRVSATNAGGESFPTATLGARIPADETTPRLLIVNGFNRNDRFMNVLENDPHSTNMLQRGYLDRLNTYNYIVPHAQAIQGSSLAVAFDSTEAAAVDNGSILLGQYDAVIWMAGLQAHVNDIGTRQTPALSGQLPSRISQYLNAGGKFFISGAEVAYDLNRAGLGGFLQNVFKADLVDRSANTHIIRGASASIMSDVASVRFDDGSGPAYRVDYPDVIAPRNGAVPLLRYPSVQTIEGFEASSGWLAPMSAGQTNAAGATFSVVSSPVVQGNGAGRLTYDWGSGDFIRLYRSSLPTFDVNSDLSLWVHGDGSGHRVQIAARDSDNDIFAGPIVDVDWTGWREIAWNDVRNSGSLWHRGGDGVVTSTTTLRFDSIFLRRSSTSPNTGAIHFDLLTATPTDGGGEAPTAGILYDGDHQLVFMAVPFETLVGEANRAAVMDRILTFFHGGETPFVDWLREHFTEAQLQDPAISGDYATPAGDGIPNLVKYALNLDPWESSPQGLPQVGVEQGHLTFTFRQSKAATDIDFLVEVSDDLANWRDASGETTVVQTVDEGDVLRITVRDNQPFPENERRFLRLRVTRE
jgi:N-acetylmuramoyl-L-alanine amidase